MKAVGAVCKYATDVDFGDLAELLSFDIFYLMIESQHLLIGAISSAI